MIARIEALNYRCLRYVCQDIGPFQVLVGPNASGKSTFLDVVALLGDMLREGLTSALARRSSDFQALTWMRSGSRLELAVELRIPEERRARLQNGHSRARYEVAIGLSPVDEVLGVLGETLWLAPPENPASTNTAPSLFPTQTMPPKYLVTPEGQHAEAGWKRVVSKKPESGNDYFIAETTKWNNPFRLGPQKLALANLPEDEDRFPVATWTKRVLMEGVRRVALNSELMRQPSPPGSPTEFQADGSSLPHIIDNFQRASPDRYGRWVDHLRTALPDLKSVETVEREEDRKRYIQLKYTSGLSAPSWVVSDGTLRLMALTLLAYITEPDRVYLIEEPENGIHPAAIETVFQSLSSATHAQVLCASHSPVILSRAEPFQVLCFAKTDAGETDIRQGDQHPVLRHWQREIDLGTLFASGVLG